MLFPSALSQQKLTQYLRFPSAIKQFQGMAVCSCDPRTRRLRQENFEFWASVVYAARHQEEEGVKYHFLLKEVSQCPLV